MFFFEREAAGFTQRSKDYLGRLGVKRFFTQRRSEDKGRKVFFLCGLALNFLSRKDAASTKDAKVFSLWLGVKFFVTQRRSECKGRKGFFFATWRETFSFTKGTKVFTEVHLEFNNIILEFQPRNLIISN